MLKSFFTKVSIVFIFAFLPFSLLANVEIIEKNVQLEIVKSVLKKFQKENNSVFAPPSLKLKLFVLPPNVNPKKSIKTIPLKLVIDDVIVFRTEKSSALELVAYSGTTNEGKLTRTNRFYVPG